MEKRVAIPKLKWVILKEITTPFFIKTIALGVAGVDTIIFTDLNNNDQFHYVVPGDGISRVAGSKTYSLFVYTERKFTPRIFIVSYPDFAVLKTLSGDNVCKYIYVDFTDTEYLVALTGYPDYMIKVWNFRLGTLMAEEISPVQSETQKLQVWTQPFLCAQYAQQLGILVIWEVYATSEHAYLIQRKVNIPFLHRSIRIDFCFGIDSLVHVVDNVGNLYNIQTSTGLTRKLYSWEGEKGSYDTLVCCYNGGFIITGPNGELVLVKKIGAFFKKIWQFRPVQIPYWVNSASSETLYALTQNSTLHQIIQTEDGIEMKQITERDNSIKYFDVVNPEGKYMAVVTLNDEFRVLETTNKNKVSSMYIPNIVIFRAHPAYPLVIYATKDYRFYLLALSFPEDPKIVLEFQLSNNPIMDLQYFRNFIVVYDYKQFFIIQGDIQVELKVIEHIKLDEEILYFTLVRQNPAFDIVALLSGRNNWSNKLMVIKSLSTGEKKYYDLPDNFYAEVRYIQNKICLTCLFETSFHILTFEKIDEVIGEDSDGKPITQKKDVVKLTPALRLPHQIKLFRVREMDNDFIYSWGLDGTVCIFNTNEGYIQTFFVAVQRRTGTKGLINAVRITPNKKYCLVHTEGGVLKCFTCNPEIADEYSPNKMLNNYFRKPIKNLVEDPDFTWLEIVRRNELELERVTFEDSRKEIYAEFLKVQEAMKILIDENEALEDEDDILPLPSFNLAKEWTEDIVEKTKKHRDAEHSSLVNFINEQNRITKYIIDHTWNKMSTKSAKVYGIMCRTMIENYSLAEKNLNHLKDRLEKIHNWRSIDKDMNVGNYFYPWINLYIAPAASKHSISTNRSESETAVGGPKEPSRALTGTTSHKFIDTHPDRFEQLEVVSFSQLWSEWFLSQTDVFHLKEYFNKEFSRMKKFKGEEIDFVKQRNARMRIIFSEMNALAKIRGEGETKYPHLEDPTFLDEEDPACIIKVDKSEIRALPYISPSQQKILDEIAYADEQRRLLLLADDFRERALIAMMDGTLEKRWEDEIKKDVQKPECMLKRRNPKDFNKDDLKAVKEYEDKVKYNFTERAKYKIMLEKEKLKLEHAQSEQILKFNEKCGELVSLKLKVDASVKQEELKILRFALFNFHRKQFQYKQEELRIKLTSRKENSTVLLSVIEEIEQEVQEIRAKYDLLQSRDRVLDKQFKNYIADMAPNFVVEQACRAFKRRPKWVAKGWATRAIYVEMANRVLLKNSGKAGLPLPEECYAFLTALDNLDPLSVAPNVIEPKLWEIVVKMRRQKIDTEFRVKALAAQLAEAEAALNVIIKEQALRKTNIHNVEKELNELYQNLSESLMNRTVQIVLPLGMIEIELSGSVEDFKGCSLLSGTDISDINTIIKKAGQKKIMAMQKVARFRRKVLFKEWEHKMLQMSVLDMKEFLSIINHSKIYIEIQDFVRDKKKKRVPKINNAILNKEIDEKVKYLKRKLTDIDVKIDEVKKKIIDQKKINNSLDKEIQDINIDVTELNMFRDIESEEQQIKQKKERLEMCMERARLVRKIQMGHAHLLELSTALELQRLRTYPTLSQMPTVFSCKQ